MSESEQDKYARSTCHMFGVDSRWPEVTPSEPRFPRPDFFCFFGKT